MGVTLKRLFLVLVFSGCNGISQSPECARYLACVDAVMDGGSASFPSYAQNGSCWSTSQGDAESCTMACSQGLHFLSLGAGRGKAECQ
jgi:hypothetical protein